MEPKKHWNLKTCISQLEYCGYGCEAGSMVMNDAFIWLKELSKRTGIDFLPGQGVFFDVEAEVNGIKLSKRSHFYIVGCRLTSDTEKIYCVYDLSNDPPGPYHYGEVQYRNVPADKLHLEG